MHVRRTSVNSVIFFFFFFSPSLFFVFSCHIAWLAEAFPDSSVSKESACIVGDASSIPGLERSPGEGKGYPTPVFSPGEFHGQYSPWDHKESDTTE